MAGTGIGNVYGAAFNFAVYSDDWFADTMLQDETSFHIYGDEDGNFSITQTFELWCNENCYVTGSKGTSGTNSANV